MASPKPHHTSRPTSTKPAQSNRHAPRCNCRGRLRAAHTPALGSLTLHMSLGMYHAGSPGPRSQECSQYYQKHQTHLSRAPHMRPTAASQAQCAGKHLSCRPEWPGCVLAPAPWFKPQSALNAPQSHRGRSVVGALQLLHNSSAACSSCMPWLWVNTMHR